MPPIWNSVKDRLKEKREALLGLSERDAERYADVFDPAHYRKQLGKADLSDRQALLHYLREGWRAGLDPSPEFSTNGYLASHPDVHAADVNPLKHYINFGLREMRLVKTAQDYTLKMEHLQPSTVQGWCVDKMNPGAVIEVRVLIDGLLFSRTRNTAARPDLSNAGISKGAGGLDVALPLQFLEAGTHTVTFETPDGRRAEKSIETTGPVQAALPRPRDGAEAVVFRIVVPIYNAAEDVAICIDRLKAYTPPQVEVILIDDCSPDPAIRDILAKVADDPRFRVLSNPENMGFTRTVNRGLKEAGDADVIILNSDARVTPGWSTGLRAAAYSRPDVATVTAMSDRAGAFSAPNIGNDNPLPPGVDEADYARAFRRRSLRLYPEVPTGNGFCMYIRRAGLDALGPLDEVAFPRGYGEENDYCMRALRAGWVNLIDDATYVFHERTKSFGATKTESITKGRAVIDARYPEYKMLIQCYHNSALIQGARYRARQALLDCSAGRGVLPRALFVTATQTGGTPQTNADLMGALEEVFETWVLRCTSRELELVRYDKGEVIPVRRHVLTEAIEPVSHRSSEYDAVVAEWLQWLDADVVHIRHLAWHSLSLPALAKRSGASVFYSLHDFYTLCPSLKLLDEENTFCGGTCTAGSGVCQIALWKTDAFPDLKNAWVHRWREMMAEAIAPCDGFITTSPSARARVLQHMPSLPEDRFHVIPHGRDFSRFEQLQAAPSVREPIRILVPGNIDVPKGLHIITEVLRLDTQRMFEFHILGGVHTSQIKGHVPRLITHDRYKREDFAQKVRAIAPHFGVVFSIWDETFCHTLTEMWSVGLPAAVLDFPTLHARVEESGAGWILEDITPEGVLAEITRIASDTEDMKARGAAAVAWQSRRGTVQSCRQMAAGYLDVYSTATQAATIPRIAVVVPTHGVRKEPNASSEIRVLERTRNRLGRQVRYIQTDVDGLIANLEMGTVSGAILQRTAIPARAIPSVIAAARSSGVPYVYELDDDLLDVAADKDTDGFYAFYKPFLTDLIRNAAVVTVSTQPLAEKIRAHNDRVEVIPNRIPARLWGGSLPDRVTDVPRLLYMGTWTHDQDLAFVLPAIERARATEPHLRLSLVGVTPRKDLPDWVDVIAPEGAQKRYGQFVPWLKTQAQNVDLAIAPLVDTEFNRFKSGLKILDYAALGLPVLASKVPCYRDLVGAQPPAGITLLANSEEVWARAILAAIRNRTALQEQGQSLRHWVFQKHALEPTLADYDRLVLQMTTPQPTS